MLLNLFSVFNPSSAYLSLNFLCSLLLVCFIPLFQILSISRFKSSFIFLKNVLKNEFEVILKKDSASMVSVFLCSVFVMVLMWNLMGLFPYIFTFTSQLVVTSSLSFPFWLTGLSYSWNYLTLSSLSHLTPSGSPISLSPLMVVIETVSFLIRPVTLSVRLAANMVAGHLLMVLISSVGPVLSNLGFLGSFSLGSSMFLCLELAVSVIQSYVIVMLITLYLAEAN